MSIMRPCAGGPRWMSGRTTRVDFTTKRTRATIQGFSTFAPEAYDDMAGGWGCPHELDDTCTKVNNLPCDPGMKGCVLAGRYVFANEDKNTRLRERQAREAAAFSAPEDEPGSLP